MMSYKIVTLIILLLINKNFHSMDEQFLNGQNSETINLPDEFIALFNSYENQTEDNLTTDANVPTRVNPLMLTMNPQEQQLKTLTTYEENSESPQKKRKQNKIFIKSFWQYYLTKKNEEDSLVTLIKKYAPEGVNKINSEKVKEKGELLLHQLARLGYSRAIHELFMIPGIIPNVVDNQGKFPSVYAHREGYIFLGTILKNYEDQTKFNRSLVLENLKNLENLKYMVTNRK